MQTLSLHGLRMLLSAFLLLTSTALWAADTDSDGVADVAPILQISAGGLHACALDGTGVHCWGSNDQGQTTVPTLSNPTAVSAGSNHTCALDDTGVVCWGYNAQGQATVPTLTNPTAVSAGSNHTCALDDNGVHCWGYNGDGQTTVPILSNPTAVIAGGYHTCALDDTGVHCWGDNGNGQTTVPALSNPTAVIAGGYHTCALDDNGAHCWGSNDQGQTTVPALTNPVAVSTGLVHTCALDDAGVHCWGDNFYGQTTVPTLSNPTAVSAGGDHTCALDDTGVHCWGGNSYGESTVPADLAVRKVLDNCPLVANADQADGDGDHLGDVCDPINGDGGNLNAVDGTVKAEQFGAVAAYVGDFNGDHFGDWAVGIPSYTIPADGSIKAIKGAGQVKIISGNDGEVLAHFEGTVAKEGFGTALAGNADVNGDGFMDVVVGSPLADNPTALPKPLKDAGSVAVIYGCKGVGCSAAVSSPKYGSTVKTSFGAAVALGDVDNDGKADVIVGEPKATNDQGEKPLKQAGKVTVLSGANLAAAPLLTVYGNTAGALAGSAVAAGDFNGTGGAEVVVGAPKDDDTEALPKPIKDAGSVKVYTNGSTTPIYAQYGTAASLYFGTAVAANQDVNKDGVKDIAVGEPGWDDTAAKHKDVGGFVVLYGNASNNYSRSADILGMEAAAKLGTTVALGDVDGNGYADIIAGAPKGDDTTPIKPIKDTGSFAVYSGNGFTALGNTQYGAAKGDGFSTSLSAGDINADGKADILIGISGKDVSVTIEGKPKVLKDAGGVKLLNATAL